MGVGEGQITFSENFTNHVILLGLIFIGVLPNFYKGSLFMDFTNPSLALTHRYAP